MIKIIKTGIGEYISRPGILGNPYKMRTEADRDHVCEAYEQWFALQVEKRNPRIMEELRRLYAISCSRDLLLKCYCAPLRCHGETIKRFLEESRANI